MEHHPQLVTAPPRPGAIRRRVEAHGQSAFHRSEAERNLEQAEALGHEDSRACEQYAAQALVHVQLAEHYLHYVEHVARYGDQSLDDS